MVRLQRQPGNENIVFDDLLELKDLARLLPSSTEEGKEVEQVGNDQATKRRAVATLLGQHFKSRWASTSPGQQQTKFGTAPWKAGLDRPVGNLAMPGAELDADRLQAIGVSYVNASSIPALVAEVNPPLPHYIATQHPMPGTVADFWRMVLVERPVCIVMLNGYDYSKVGEYDAAEACASYWLPKSLGSDTGLVLEEIEEQRVPNHGAEDVVRTLRISLSGTPHDHDGTVLNGQGMSHVVRQVFVSWWRDQSSPTMKRFSGTWHLVNDLLLDAAEEGLVAPKVVVHCAGGIGRVGVWIAVDMCVRAMLCESGIIKETLVGLEKRETVVSPDIAIGYLRSRRVNMVQSEEQYFFLHLAVERLVRSLRASAASLPSFEQAA